MTEARAEVVDVPYELSEIEKIMIRAVSIKTKDSPCPRCENTTYFILGPTSSPWLVVCCQNCGFKLEYLADVLLKDVDEEANRVE